MNISCHPVKKLEVFSGFRRKKKKGRKKERKKEGTEKNSQVK